MATVCRLEKESKMIGLPMAVNERSLNSANKVKGALLSYRVSFFLYFILSSMSSYSFVM